MREVSYGAFVMAVLQRSQREYLQERATNSVLKRELEEHKKELAGKEKELAGKEKELAGKEKELEGKEKELQGKEKELQRELIRQQQREIARLRRKRGASEGPEDASPPTKRPAP